MGVINARIVHAKTLLSSSMLSIGEIAEQCGYANVEHFIRQFKATTGTTPEKYRSK